MYTVYTVYLQFYCYFYIIHKPDRESPVASIITILIYTNVPGEYNVLKVIAILFPFCQKNEKVGLVGLENERWKGIMKSKQVENRVSLNSDLFFF